MFYRLSSLLVLSILLLSMSGYYPIFKLEQWKIRKEVKKRMKESLPLEDLVCVSSQNADEIEWEEEGKEFRYKGQMYDIVYVENMGSMSHYYCIHDEEETGLFVQLDELVKKQMDDLETPIGKTAKNLLKVFFSLQYIPSGNIEMYTGKEFLKHNTTYLFFPSSDFIQELTPPPQNC
jgi:hypothetical protein